MFTFDNMGKFSVDKIIEDFPANYSTYSEVTGTDPTDEYVNKLANLLKQGFPQQRTEVITMEAVANAMEKSRTRQNYKNTMQRVVNDGTNEGELSTAFGRFYFDWVPRKEQHSNSTA
jgi:hypothetical protein